MQRCHKPSLVLENKIFKYFFPDKCIGKQTWPCCKKVKCQYTTIILATPVPDDLCKDSAPKHPRFWRRSFLKVFTIYGHGGHLGQRTATILAIFRSPNLRGSIWNLSKIGPDTLEEKLFEILNKCIRKQNWPYRKKVKCQCMTIILATLVALSFRWYMQRFSHKVWSVLEKIFKDFSHTNA